MRIIYGLNGWLHAQAIALGGWALRKRHRPLLLSAGVIATAHIVALGLLALMEMTFRR